MGPGAAPPILNRGGGGDADIIVACLFNGMKFNGTPADTIVACLFNGMKFNGTPSFTACIQGLHLPYDALANGCK